MPWIHENGSVDEDLKSTYMMHRAAILANHVAGTVQSTYNIPLADTLDPTQLLDFVRGIYQAERFAFR
jgi:hypothetical protein